MCKNSNIPSNTESNIWFLTFLNVRQRRDVEPPENARDVYSHVLINKPVGGVDWRPQSRNLSVPLIYNLTVFLHPPTLAELPSKHILIWTNNTFHCGVHWVRRFRGCSHGCLLGYVMPWHETEQFVLHHFPVLVICNYTLFSKGLDWFLLAHVVSMGTKQMTHHRRGIYI